MVCIVLGKRHCKGVKDGQSYDYDKFVYGVPDPDGVGLTCESVNVDHRKEHGQIPLYEPVEAVVGVKYGKLKVVAFDTKVLAGNLHVDNIINLMRDGGGGQYMGEDWDA